MHTHFSRLPPRWQRRAPKVPELLNKINPTVWKILASSVWRFFCIRTNLHLRVNFSCIYFLLFWCHQHFSIFCNPVLVIVVLLFIFFCLNIYFLMSFRFHFPVDWSSSILVIVQLPFLVKHITLYGISSLANIIVFSLQPLFCIRHFILKFIVLFYLAYCAPLLGKCPHSFKVLYPMPIRTNPRSMR